MPLNRRTFLATAATVGSPAVAGCASDETGGDGAPTDTEPRTADADETAGSPDDAGESFEFDVETVAEGFERPWGLTFLPDGPELLVTQRRGVLKLVDRERGDVREVEGTPEVFSGGQGGLLDVTTHPAFPEPAWVYLTYTQRNEGEASTTLLGRGRLDRDGPRLVDVEVVHEAEPYREMRGLYGSRVVFGPDGLVYFSVGSRSEDLKTAEGTAQEVANDLGSTLRLEPDGGVPADNPFVDGDGSDAVYTYGHRNPQGMAVHPETGEIWQSEHGEEDGDEFNVLEAGGNYGWPVARYGCTYEGEPIGDDPAEREDVVDPVHHWPCDSGGFPPAGMAFYDGDAFPAWRGDLFVGSLAGQALGRFAVDGHDVAEREHLLADRGWRVRDVAVAPDTGHLYVAIDEESVPLVRLVPA